VRFKNESFIYHTSLTLQCTSLLPTVSIFAFENTRLMHQVPSKSTEHKSSDSDVLSWQKLLKLLYKSFAGWLRGSSRYLEDKKQTGNGLAASETAHNCSQAECVGGQGWSSDK